MGRLPGHVRQPIEAEVSHIFAAHAHNHGFPAAAKRRKQHFKSLLRRKHACGLWPVAQPLAGCHAHARPCIPADGKSWQTKAGAVAGKSIQKGVGRRVIALPRCTHQGRARRGQHKEGKVVAKGGLVQVPGSRHLGGQHGLVILLAAGEQIPPARHARRVDDALHGADLAPNLGKGDLDLHGICDVATVSVKGHAGQCAGQRVGRRLAAAVQQHHARAAVLVNLPRKGLAHAAKTAGNHHAALAAGDGSGHGRGLQADKLTHAHRAIGSHHIRPVDAPKAGRQSRHTGRSDRT